MSWVAAAPGAALLEGCLMNNAKAGDASVRFKDVGVVLVVDAVPGAELLGVEFFAEGSLRRFYASSLVAKRNREIMAFPLERPPMQVRVVWRDSSKIVGRKDNPNIDTYDGNILGDYTIPIASRIPDSVVEALKRNRKGDLRLKFRLKPDGVLFGWDIERRPGWKPGLSVRPVYEEVGGDFTETFY
jgi:hypothetical protein